MRKPILLLATLLLAAAAHANPATPPPTNAAYRNFQKARAILNAALAAHSAGVGEALPAEAIVPYTGTLTYRGHFLSPTTEHHYPVSGEYAFSRALDAWKLRGIVVDSADTSRSWTIVQGGKVFNVDYDDARATNTTAADLPRYRREAMLPLPLETLRTASRRAEALSWLGEETSKSGPQDILGYATEDGLFQHLAIDRKTHRLLRVEQLLADDQDGDMMTWVAYSNYLTPRGSKLPWPGNIQYRIKERTWDLKLDLGKINLTPSLQAEAFALPDTFAKAIPDWKVEAPTPPLPPLVADSIGRDLYMIPIPERDAKVIFAAMDDYIVAFDAPIAAETGQRILDAIHARVPHKPVRYLVMSHHHEHYVGGMRAFVNVGATLVTTPGTVALLRERARANHMVAPDSLQRHPREAKIFAIKGKHVFEDAHHRVELHDIGEASHHTHEYIVSYFPWEKLAYEGDLANFPEGGPAKRLSPRARGLYESIKARGLNVERIVQEWPMKGQRREGTYKELEELAAAKP